MTLDKSDAQLDAEAAAPLSELIRKHRMYYRRDLYKPVLASDDPPVLFDGDEAEVQVSEIGMALSWPLTSHVFSETRFIEEDGDRVEEPVYSIHSPDSMWSKAAFAQWAQCRRGHPEHHERKAFQGSLCKLLVGRVIRGGFEPDEMAYQLQLDRERVAETLRSALKAIDREMQRLIDKGMTRHSEDQGRFTIFEERPVHHAVPGLHMQECPQCKRLTGDEHAA